MDAKLVICGAGIAGVTTAYQLAVKHGMKDIVIVDPLPPLSLTSDKSTPFVDGGYYARTPENRPLIGPLGVEGAYIIGGLGGFGMMSSCGASDLLAKYITGKPLPEYAPAFLLSRYDDPGYQEILRHWGSSGQL
jgi:glycine/D-amino acid oxidase-like deaminating enzyme